MVEARPIEIYDPPAFEPGQKVRSVTEVRNDGTMPNLRTGEVIVGAGDVGYVTRIGEHLQRYYVYTVDFIDRGRLVGMRSHEIEALPEG